VNVLLVEDEPRVADFIDRGLRAENHGVTVAGSGTEGVDLAKTGEFDVIVLDLMLPDMHGYDVCQKLRSEGDQTPILMLTAMDTLEDKIKGLKIGADDYLAKPFDFDELLARIISCRAQMCCRWLTSCSTGTCSKSAAAARPSSSRRRNSPFSSCS
jgi:DNA-binding response OmpR family regulator